MFGLGGAMPSWGQSRQPNTSTYGVDWLYNDETMARSDAQVVEQVCVAKFVRRCQQREAYAKSQNPLPGFSTDVAGRDKVAGPMTESLASYSPWLGKAKHLTSLRHRIGRATTKMPETQA